MWNKVKTHVCKPTVLSVGGLYGVTLPPIIETFETGEEYVHVVVVVG